MKYVILLMVFDLVHHCAYGVTTVTEKKREAGEDLWGLKACNHAYTSLSAGDIKNCFNSGFGFSNIRDGLLTADDLVGICASAHCMRVATTLLENCTVGVIHVRT